MPNVETADEEVAFWRGFIERWAREKDEPVPPRVWAALAYAERKQERSPMEQYETSVALSPPRASSPH
jgi:hypothetical protein